MRPLIQRHRASARAGKPANITGQHARRDAVPNRKAVLSGANIIGVLANYRGTGIGKARGVDPGVDRDRFGRVQ